MLRRQPSSKDRARKSWEAILGLRYFGSAKSGEREGGWVDFVAFDVVYAVQEVSKTASKGAQNGSYCPGNERCAVDFASVVGICLCVCDTAEAGEEPLRKRVE